MPPEAVPPKARLTAAVIERFPVRMKDYFVADEAQPKLKLKVTPAGNKSFVVRYRTKTGLERKYKLGDFPDLNATKAREMASEVLLRVAMGEDPTTDSERQRHGKTLQTLAQAYLRDHAAIHLRPKQSNSMNTCFAPRPLLHAPTNPFRLSREKILSRSK